MYEELYVCSFKDLSLACSSDDCFRKIVNRIGIKCTVSEITKLAIVYTSLGEIFEKSFDESRNENLFSYFDSICRDDQELFESIHIKFIHDVLNEKSNDLKILMQIGLNALIGDKFENKLVNYH